MQRTDPVNVAFMIAMAMVISLILWRWPAGVTAADRDLWAAIYGRANPLTCYNLALPCPPKDQARIEPTFVANCLIKQIDRSGKPAWLEGMCSR